MSKQLSLLLLVMVLSPSLLAMPSNSIRYAGLVAYSDSLNKYLFDQLDLALKKSESVYGPYQLSAIQPPMYQSVALQALKKRNSIDVVSTQYSQEREAHAKVIKLDLLRGLNDFKVILYNKIDKQAFEDIRSLNDLSGFIGLQGHDWPDSYFLRQAGLRLQSDFLFEKMIKKLLEGKRYYLLSPLFLVEDHTRRAGRDLIIQEKLMLYYESPIYYYVNKSNSKLAERIEYGLKQALNDGSFENLFLSFLRKNESFRSIAVEMRKLIELKASSDEKSKPIRSLENHYTISDLIDLKKRLD